MPKTKIKPRVRVKSARAAKPNGLRYSFKLEGELNISAYVARQKVNGYLIRNVANLITSDEPDLELRSSGAFWVVPIVLAIPGIGRLGPLGQIVIDADHGDIVEKESTPCEELEKNADRLAEEKAL